MKWYFISLSVLGGSGLTALYSLDLTEKRELASQNGLGMEEKNGSLSYSSWRKEEKLILWVSS